MFEGINSLMLEQACLQVIDNCYPNYTIIFDYDTRPDNKTEEGHVDFFG